MRKSTRIAVWIVLLAVLACTPVLAKKKQAEEEARDEGPMSAANFSGFMLRELGPALMSGRIGDLAVDPTNHARYFVAVASGGVWRTENSGTTWTPVFDGEGSYSIGCVTLDPNDPLTVWVGTGENNSQRSVGYGDGVYKSVDGGRNWEKVGLENSEHIGKILVDPRDSDTVYVAAQGPLWAAGGDRGLYKTEDGGKTWALVLEIDRNTGVSDIAFDPRNPDVLYATSYQRRRHTWTLINGGPGSAMYKTTDAGASWRKLENGLPSVDMGRIGIAVSPVDPDTVYAIVEAQGDEGGFFRSTDAGANWEKRNDYMSQSAQYYNEIIADPKKVNRVYSMDTRMHVTEDGGKTFHKVDEKAKHVDNHALWIDPGDTDHLLAGCDGGLYETWDRGATWQFKANLPVTQFYKVTPDNDSPFYNVYGGTQDNATLGGPSRTATVHGIRNSDWYITLFGDGFKARIDPENPDIVYSQYQYGGLARFDRRSGERIGIQPQPGPADDPLRWNWDSALILSPHSPKRLYYACQRIFRSDDRGDSWRPVSPDLSRGLDRNRLEVMEKIWSVDAVAKNDSTSFYGSIVALAESPLAEGLIYAGTDDGLVQVTEDGGENWRRIDRIPGVPEMTYVNRLEASVHDADTVYGAFNNHKQGDFRPYLMKSADRGRTWTSITGDLPERGSTYAVVEDHENRNLLFAGTEFGLFFTVDGGEKWIRLKSGLPTIAVRDLEIQRRENDLVVGSFGRGIYILDDYSPLRQVEEKKLEQGAALFPVRDAWMYIPSNPLARRGSGYQGDAFYTAPNPPFGAVFTYYLKDGIDTLAAERKKREREIEEEGGTVSYPSWDDLSAEDREEKPSVFLVVRDEEGNVVRRVPGPTGHGFHRIAWDLRYPAANPTDPERKEGRTGPTGPLASPGRYSVSLAKRVRGEWTVLAGPTEFRTAPLGLAILTVEDRPALLEFQKKTARLQRAVLGSVRAASEARTRIDHLRSAIDDTPGATPELAVRVRELEKRLRDLQVELSGDATKRRRNEPTLPSITQRVQRIVSGQWRSTSAPTGTNRQAYEIAASLFAPVLERLTALIEADLKRLEDELEAAGGPWTPGRVPRWNPE